MKKALYLDEKSAICLIFTADEYREINAPVTWGMTVIPPTSR